MSRKNIWRPATPGDLDVVMTIQDRVHTLLPERPEIFLDKLAHFGDGCFVLEGPDGCLGYGISHPWTLGDAPALDTPLGALPERTDCLFIHDVALLPAARGQGAGKAYVERMTAIARQHGSGAMALVSVYGTAPVWMRLGFAIRRDRIAAEKLAGYGETACYMVRSGDQASMA